MEKEARVHRLRTEDKSQIWKWRLGLTFMKNPSSPAKGAEGSPQHLYITTDEEIKEGDWVWHKDLKSVMQTGKDLPKYNQNTFEKIIASTDPELSGKTGQLPQSFIEEYCKAGGIDNVSAEYIGQYRAHVDGEPIGLPIHNPIPKLDPDNCIIIHPVEEKKIYSIDDLRNAYYVGRNYQRTGDIDLHFENWIKTIQ